jgi:hypothetical protein
LGLISTATPCAAQAARTASNLDFIAGPAQKLPSGYVTKDGGMGIGDSPNDSVHLRLAIHLEPGMHAGNHEVEPLEHRLRVVVGTVRENVGFDPLEDLKLSSEAFVEPVDGVVLLRNFFERLAAGVVRGFRMIGNPEIPIAALAGRVGHRFQRIQPVRQIRMRVQDAPQIVVFDQAWQFAPHSPRNLVAPFAQLGRNKRQVKRAVDLGFRLGRNNRSAALEAIGRQRQSAGPRTRLQRIEVRSRSGSK